MRSISSLASLMMASWSGADAESPTAATADEACANACQPGLGTEDCTIGGRISLQFGIVYVGTETTTDYFGVCPTVDNLVGISLQKDLSKIQDGGSAFLKVNHFTTPQTFDPLDTDRDPEHKVPAAYIKVAESNGPTDVFHADVVVLNVTMSNGEFVGIVNSNTTFEWDGPGFHPTCDESGSCIDIPMDDTRMCIGNVTGKQNCAVKTAAATSANGASTRVIILYYGTDSNGNSFTSGTTSPFTYDGFSRSFNPFSALANAF